GVSQPDLIHERGREGMSFAEDKRSAHGIVRVPAAERRRSSRENEALKLDPAASEAVSSAESVVEPDETGVVTSPGGNVPDIIQSTLRVWGWPELQDPPRNRIGDSGAFGRR